MPTLDLGPGVQYFIEAPAGEPDTVLGSIAALVAMDACGVENCMVSTACNPFTRSPERYKRRARLGDCGTCLSTVALNNTLRQPHDPSIVEVDPGTYLRTEAHAAMTEFWTVVDAAGGTNQLFDLEGRQRIAEAIIAHYATDV